MTVHRPTNQVPLLAKLGARVVHKPYTCMAENSDNYRLIELRSGLRMATGAEEWNIEPRLLAGVSGSSVNPADSPKLGIVLTVYSGVCYSFD